jgi:hypothetical protein
MTNPLRDPTMTIGTAAVRSLFAALMVALTLLFCVSTLVAEDAAELIDEAGALLVDLGNSYSDKEKNLEAIERSQRRLRQIQQELLSKAKADPKLQQNDDFRYLTERIEGFWQEHGVVPATLDGPTGNVQLPPGGRLGADSGGRKADLAAPPDTIAWTLEGMPARGPEEVEALNRWLDAYQNSAILGTPWLQREMAAVRANGTDARKWSNYYDARISTALALILHPGKATLSPEERERYSIGTMVAQFVRAELDPAIDRQPPLDFRVPATFKNQLGAYQNWVAALPSEFVTTIQEAPKGSGVTGAVIVAEDFETYRIETRAAGIVAGLGIRSTPARLNWLESPRFEDLETRYSQAQRAFRNHLLFARPPEWWTKTRADKWASDLNALGEALVDVERVVLMLVGADPKRLPVDDPGKPPGNTEDAKRLEALQRAQFNAWLIYRLRRFHVGAQGLMGGVSGTDSLVKADWARAMIEDEKKYQESQQARSEFVGAHFMRTSGPYSDQIKRGLEVAWQSMPKFYVHGEKRGDKESDPTFYKDIIGWEQYKKYGQGGEGKQSYFAYFGDQAGYEALLSEEELASFLTQNKYRLEKQRR